MVLSKLYFIALEYFMPLFSNRILLAAVNMWSPKRSSTTFSRAWATFMSISFSLILLTVALPSPTNKPVPLMPSRIFSLIWSPQEYFTSSKIWSYWISYIITFLSHLFSKFCSSAFLPQIVRHSEECPTNYVIPKI